MKVSSLSIGQVLSRLAIQALRLQSGPEVGELNRPDFVDQEGEGGFT